MSLPTQNRSVQRGPTTLRLVSDNPDPQPEMWHDRPRNTLVTFTLPKETVDGCHYAVWNLLEANRNMFLALEAAREGDTAQVEKQIDRAMGQMVSANAHAARLYESIKRTARRTNRRGGRA